MKKITSSNENERSPLSVDFPPVKYELETHSGTIYDDCEKNAMLEVLKDNIPTSSKRCEQFEKDFAEYTGSKYAIAVSNGTAALFLAFKAIDIRPGDEVITTPITWIATAASAVVLGAKIKFCDIDPETFNMDPQKLEALITPKTKAIVPVHLYGQPVDMDPILEIADKYNLFVIEDAAHAPGGRYKGRKCGNLGSIGCFSFHEQKNMATGEGGMITTSDYELYQRARLYKSHCAMVVGGSSKYLQLPPEAEERALASKRYWFQDFADCGYNFRISDLTAAIGICQLKKLDNMNEIRNKLAWEFTKRLDEVEGIAPLKKIEDVYHTYHLYPVILDKEFIHQKNLSREDIIYALRMKYRIKVGVHYMPLVETTAFMNRGYSQKDSPIAYERWPLLITLPIHPRLTQEGVDYLFDSLSQIMK